MGILLIFSFFVYGSMGMIFINSQEMDLIESLQGQLWPIFTEFSKFA